MPAAGLQQLSKLSVCEYVKDVDAQGKEAGVQLLQHTIRNPDLAEARQCVERRLGCDDPGTCLCE